MLAKAVIFKLNDDDQVWVADLEKGTVIALVPPAGSDLEKAIQAGVQSKGLAFATAVASASEAYSGHVDN